MEDMAEHSSRPVLHAGTWERIEQRLDRIEDKLDGRMSNLDQKVDAFGSRLDRLEGRLTGSFMMLRWIGPAGMAALLYGLAKSAGLVP